MTEARGALQSILESFDCSPPGNYLSAAADTVAECGTDGIECRPAFELRRGARRVAYQRRGRGQGPRPPDVMYEGGSLTCSVRWSPGMRGPVFLQEPPPVAHFSNTTGAVLSCAAHGSPPPDIRWLDAGDKELSHVPRLRQLLSNGSLHFPPFAADEFTPEIHVATYRCRAANPGGVVVSRDCRVRADVSQPYQVQVQSALTLTGNVAMLRCDVPSFVHALVAVTGWQSEEPPHPRATLHPGGRFVMTASGSLHVAEASPSDGRARYYCWTRHVLTGQQRLSAPGQLEVTEPEGNLAPRIEHSSTIVKVRAGNTADLVCVGKGNPPPVYRWYRKAPGALQEIPAGSVLVRPLQSVLRIPRAQVEDSARYVCKLGNVAGEDSRELSLVVTEPLSAHMRPQQQVVDAGSSAHFNCSVAVGGSARMSWLKDGRPLADGARINLLRGGRTLVVRSVRKEDRGMYQCVVRDGEDSAQASGELVLGAVAPELQSTFIEQTLQPGPPVSLRCVASGNPPPRFTWLLDAVELQPRSYVLGSFLDQAGDVVSHLNISSAKVQHGGLYTCVARNLLGAAQHSATLNIYGPPSARAPRNITAVAGTDVFLRCPVAGFPISSVTWQRGGDALPSHLRHRTFPNGTLLVRQVDGPADRGEYLCFAANQQGQTAQSRVHLDVMKPPTIAPFQFPSEIQQGMRVQVTCSIISGDFPIAISWRKDGEALSESELVHEERHEFSSSLTFRDLAARHSGRYTCVAANAAATANYTAKLVVKVPPSWLIEPRDVSVQYHQPASMHCMASGFPFPSVTWLRARGSDASDYVTLESGPDVILYGNGSVLLRAAEPSHEGFYTCQASNGIGAGLSKVVFVRVNAPEVPLALAARLPAVPPHFKTHAVNQSGVAGEAAVLVCEVEGDQPLRVSWTAVRHALTPLHSRMVERATPTGRVLELHLERLERRDAGPYRCSASNDFGQDELVLHLAVKEPPEPPDQVEVVEVGSRWLSVAWGRPYPSHVPVDRYVVQHRAEDAPAWANATASGAAHSLRIEGLQPSTPYAVRLLAGNEVGESAPGPVAMAITLQEGEPRRLPGPPFACSVSSWQGPPITLQEGEPRLLPPPRASHPREEVQGYQVLYREAAGAGDSPQRLHVKGRSQLQAMLTGLRQFCRYEVAVQAANAVGAGPLSPPLHVTTLDGVPDRPPQDVQCSALSSQSLRVRWDPPPPDHQNGIVVGYKVVYRHTDPVHGMYREAEVKKTTNLETNLHGLSKFSNYSVRVLAFTVAGEGVRSEPVHCTTEEDLPGPPEQIKALAMTSDSILVAWTRPVDPNGNIVKYYVYIHAKQDGNNDVQTDAVFGDAKLIYEARRLKEFQRYEFWVTAATVVGEGPSSAKVTQSPVSRVPARIASFSRRVVVGSGGAVELPCRAVGLPAPTRRWRGPGGAAGRHPARPDHALRLERLRPADAGNYTCAAENVFGRDEVAYQLVVQVAPGAPQLGVAAGGARSLALAWRAPDTGGSPITGYVLRYRHAAGDWQEALLDAEHTSHRLEGLLCGSTYHATLAASNAVGTGEPSPVVTATTQGGAPKLPPQELLEANSTSVTLHLGAWPDGGCPIRRLEARYRPQQQGGEWVAVPGEGQPPGSELVVPDLLPATWYVLRVAAHNDAGSAEQEFLFATRTHTGEIFLMDMVADTSEQASSFYPHLNVIIPVISGIICTIAVTVCVCIVVHRRHHSGYKPGSPGHVAEARTLAEQENQRNSSQQEARQAAPACSPSSTRKADSSLSVQKGSNTSGEDYDICPYATFSLPGQQPLHYAKQFRTFGQSECYAGRPPPGGERYARAGRPHEPGAEPRPRCTSKSPPDGLSLGNSPCHSPLSQLTDQLIGSEISCISSQQTLPVSMADAGRQRGAKCRGGSGSGDKTARVHQRSLHTPHDDSVNELDSSTESAEASPEVNHRFRQRGAWRGTPSRHVAGEERPERVPLKPPCAFSDCQADTPGAGCDRKATAPALPLFQHEKLEKELSTLVNRYRRKRDREKQDYTIDV
ncbi:cell adhesion molecule Dscam2-like [Bacillus rossius redtenbacheri]|uniref:cell adhesion molecule Dscam2-like n=1 Tax=Bacillus rossius redtenbacheri TaxID=93214 RepID=UPI002FDEC199